MRLVKLTSQSFERRLVRRGGEKPKPKSSPSPQQGAAPSQQPTRPRKTEKKSVVIHDVYQVKHVERVKDTNIFSEC